MARIPEPGKQGWFERLVDILHLTWIVICIILGAAIGAWFGWSAGGLLGAIAGLVGGAVLGGLVGVFGDLAFQAIILIARLWP